MSEPGKVLIRGWSEELSHRIGAPGDTILLTKQRCTLALERKGNSQRLLRDGERYAINGGCRYAHRCGAVDDLQISIPIMTFHHFVAGVGIEDLAILCGLDPHDVIAVGGDANVLASYPGYHNAPSGGCKRGIVSYLLRKGLTRQHGSQQKRGHDDPCRAGALHLPLQIHDIPPFESSFE